MKRITRVASKPSVRRESTEFHPDNLYSSLDALQGAKIASIVIMPAEVPRTVDEYILVKVELPDGRLVRLILLATEVRRPCPRDTDMWEVEDFFTREEHRARRFDKALELPEFEDG